MSNLTLRTNQEFTAEQRALIKRTLLDSEKVIFTEDELALFINQAQRTGLDPFTRQIYATKNQGKMSVQATVDGLRLIAERSGKYAGQTRPTYFDDQGKEYKIWPKEKGYPYAVEVGVLRHDFKEPVYAIAIFEEYAQKTKDWKTGEIRLGFMWAKMPALMLAKVAESLALRKAFPNDLSGIYSREEMEQNEDNKIEEQAGANQTSTQNEATLNLPPVSPQTEKPPAVKTKKKEREVAPIEVNENPERDLSLAGYVISVGPLCKWPTLGQTPENEAKKWITMMEQWEKKPNVIIPDNVREAVNVVKKYWGI